MENMLRSISLLLVIAFAYSSSSSAFLNDVNDVYDVPESIGHYDLLLSGQQQKQQTIEAQIRRVSMAAGLPFPLSPPQNTHILILPGFGTESDDYMKQGSLVPNLLKRGWDRRQVHVLPVSRNDWMTHTIFRSMLDLSFWQAKASPLSPAYRWYLYRTAKAIRQINTEVEQQYGGSIKAKTILVGHSAGGWLARAAVGYGKLNHDSDLQIDIDTLLGIVTLGSPNLPSPNHEFDFTGGALRDVNNRFPGAYFKDRLFYITAAGNAVTGNSYGNALSSRSSKLSGAATAFTVPARIKKLAYHSYKSVSGKGVASGDGIIPVSVAHLEGALQINLDKVFHAAELSVAGSWYGSDGILDQWHSCILTLLEYLRV